VDSFCFFCFIGTYGEESLFLDVEEDDRYQACREYRADTRYDQDSAQNLRDVSNVRAESHHQVCIIEETS
jgi:hypothetical protein